MRIRIERDTAALAGAEWNRLNGGTYPFLRHEFLEALETTGCLGRRVGWLPEHLILEDAEGRLVGACPLYRKLNSFGEFVFDWSWAEAYARAGLAYYPKWVVAPPFTPATGPRLLVQEGAGSADRATRLLAAAIEAARAAGVSSLHFLFATDPVLLQSPELLPRLGYQFHWEDRGFGDFEGFLAALTAKRRKEILRERRLVRDAGIELRRVRGDELEPASWQAIHALYCTTFAKHGNFPALTLRFFERLAATMGDRVMVVLAWRRRALVAAAYFLVGDQALYGRYWGCLEEVPGLHFEACYYQGIEYCLERGLRRFEPGAQGEHKIARGFLPTATHSLHWIADPDFRVAIDRHLQRERPAVAAYMAVLAARSPYREPPVPDAGVTN